MEHDTAVEAGGEGDVQDDGVASCVAVDRERAVGEVDGANGEHPVTAPIRDTVGHIEAAAAPNRGLRARQLTEGLRKRVDRVQGGGDGSLTVPDLSRNRHADIAELAAVGSTEVDVARYGSWVVTLKRSCVANADVSSFTAVIELEAIASMSFIKKAVVRGTAQTKGRRHSVFEVLEIQAAAPVSVLALGTQAPFP